MTESGLASPDRNCMPHLFWYNAQDQKPGGKKRCRNFPRATAQRIRVWVGSFADRNFSGSSQEFHERFRPIPAATETETLALVGLAANSVVALQLTTWQEWPKGCAPGAQSDAVQQSVRSVVDAAVRLTKIRCVADAFNVACRPDLDGDTISQLFLRCDTKTTFKAARATCHFWRQISCACVNEWMVEHFTVHDVKQLPSDSPLIYNWLLRHADVAVAQLTTWEIRSMVPSSGEHTGDSGIDEILLRRLLVQKNNQMEGIAMRMTSSTG